MCPVIGLNGRYLGVDVLADILKNPKTAVIIGGGLAGMAAAVALSERGVRVTLIERRSFLGGRACSFPMSASGELVDNCQHVLMPCCTNLMDFYSRINVAEHIHFHKKIPFIDAQGRASLLKRSFLPAPMHTAFSFMRMKPYTIKDKAAITSAFLCMLAGKSIPPELDRMPFMDWLKKHGQPTGAIERFWRVILVSALNEDLETLSTWHAFKVFRDGFLMHERAFEPGLADVPLGSLYETSRLEGLRAPGELVVQCQRSVIGFEIADNRVSAIQLAGGEHLGADYYVSAMPFWLLLKVLPASIIEQHACFSRLREMAFSPITSVDLWLDREVTEMDFAVLLDKKTQWVFNKHRNFAPNIQEKGFHLALVTSASRELAGKTRMEIKDTALGEIREVFPEARDAKLLDWRVMTEPRATFSAQTGIEALRPGQTTPISNLFLAGDWTHTGWPATMEGAVRSGYLCAEEILKREGAAHNILQPDLPKRLAPSLVCWLLSMI